MSKFMDKVNRKFKLLFYQISHGELIIRSFKQDLDKKYDSNIDIYFGDVSYIEIPDEFNGLEIDKAIQEDRIYLSNKLEKDILLENIYVLISNGKRYYIIASVISIKQNNLDFMELPIVNFVKGKE